MAVPRPVVLVTGASAGIGAACVPCFAASGWDVIPAARRIEKLEALAVEVRAQHPNARIHPLACDVNDDASVAAAFNEAGRTFGKLDALINNAGYAVYGTVDATPLDDFRANMETNYFGIIRCTKAALPWLRAATKGADKVGRYGAAVVMVSSFVGRRAVPGAGSYCASKFAVEGLAESLRIELRGERISVSVVNPGVTKTDFFDVAGGERPKSFVRTDSGMAPEKVARVILDCVRRPRRNVYLTVPGKAGVFLQWLSPSLFDWAMARRWKG